LLPVRAGLNGHELAALFGIDRATVSIVLDRHGVDRQYHDRREVDLDLAAALHATRPNVTEVAARLENRSENARASSSSFSSPERGLRLTETLLPISKRCRVSSDGLGR
jgi:hypothetical protein